MRIVLSTILSLVTLCSWAQVTHLNSIDNAVFGSQSIVREAGPGGYIVFTQDQGYFTRFNRCGEELFSGNIDIPGNPNFSDFITLSNGDLAVLAASANIRRDPIIARLDSLGNILWVNQYVDANGDVRQFPYSLIELPNGNLCIYGNGESLSTLNVSNVLIWIDPQGNFLQGRQYNLGGIWGAAIATDDQGVLFRTGNRFVKIDDLGFIQWAREFIIPNTESNFPRPVETQSGYVFCNRLNGSSLTTVTKISKGGDWEQTIRFDKRGSLGRPVRLDSNSIGVPISIEQLNGQTNATIVKLGGDSLNIENRVTLQSQFYLPQDLAELNNGFIAVSGNTGFPAKVFAGVVGPNLTSGCTQIIGGLDALDFPASQNTLNLLSAPFPINSLPFIGNVNTPNLTIRTECIPNSFLSLGPDTSFCEGTTAVLGSQFGPLNGNYEWSTGANTFTIEVDRPGTYWLKVTLGCGLGELTDTVEIRELPNPSFTLGRDRYLCEGEEIILKGPDCVGCEYQWSNGRSTPNIVVQNPGVYRLTVENENGCSVQDDLEIFGEGCNCDYFMPNAFSPNGDDRNEFIRPVFNCEFEDFKFLIYDRWGQLVFDSRDPFIAWDGKVDNKVVSAGIFMYSIEYNPLIQGEKQGKVFRRGYLTLLR